MYRYSIEWKGPIEYSTDDEWCYGDIIINGITAYETHLLDKLSFNLLEEFLSCYVSDKYYTLDELLENFTYQYETHTLYQVA